MKNTLLFLQALSPLHAGTGQGVDVIDLPIAREKSTGIPFLPGSSIKGVVRDQANSILGASEVNAIFGKEDLENAGAAVFTDARLLCLPVRSLAGTFAYVTSPYLLKRFARDLEMTAVTGAPINNDFSLQEGQCATAEETALTMNQNVYLEELDLTPNQTAETWAEWLSANVVSPEWKTFFKARLCVVHDDAMTFLLETATEVVARIRLEPETKTVQQGALWYEESLPTESILVGIVQTTAERRKKDTNQESKLSAKKVLEKLSDLFKKPMQFGGKSSVGRGLCQLRFIKAGEADAES
jgi:CRISPR-associated protein Cmr4